jgi:DNA-binding HxlR family transcriptional regulator
VSTPEALRWSTDNCPIERAVGLFGDRWSFLVLREVFSGIRRFDDLRVRTHIPRQVLSARLSALISAGLLRREPYREPGQRTRQEYRLTQKGLDLYPVLVALLDWGSRYGADDSSVSNKGTRNRPTVATHLRCGGEVRAALICDRGHEVTEVRDIAFALGPGARRRSA